MGRVSSTTTGHATIELKNTLIDGISVCAEIETAFNLDYEVEYYDKKWHLENMVESVVSGKCDPYISGDIILNGVMIDWDTTPSLFTMAETIILGWLLNTSTGKDLVCDTIDSNNDKFRQECLDSNEEQMEWEEKEIKRIIHNHW
jgi:hypothetical protein